MLTMFLTCDNGLISAIFLRDLCVHKTKPVRSLRNLCVTIDQCALVILDVARCYLWLFTLYINIKIGKIVVKC